MAHKNGAKITTASRAATMPKHNARDKEIARRNKRIVQMYTRKRRSLNQVELAAEFKLSQGRVSQILRNPNSREVAV